MSYIFLEGRDVNISCVISSSPLPKIFWHKEKTIIHANQNDVNTKYRILNQKLSPTVIRTILAISKFSKSDTGNYRCSAKNEMGRVKHSLHTKSTIITSSVYNTISTYGKLKKAKFIKYFTYNKSTRSLSTNRPESLISKGLRKEIVPLRIVITILISFLMICGCI
ncbi:unnamed protein product [Gordionus sp. m RMFG-2023]